MNIAALHPWDLTPTEAIELQRKLQGALILHDDFADIELVAGVDVGFEDAGSTTRAAVVVLDFPGLQLVEQSVARTPTVFPYVPGLLSFREIPALLQAFSRLSHHPDMVLCDGQGLAHPRRLGIACHLGLILQIPTIGVAKTRLVGSHGPVPAGKGDWTPLHYHDDVVGAVLRTRQGVKPVFVSVGHKVGLESAIRMVMNCITRYRLPETTRAAHKLASG